METLEVSAVVGWVGSSKHHSSLCAVRRYARRRIAYLGCLFRTFSRLGTGGNQLVRVGMAIAKSGSCVHRYCSASALSLDGEHKRCSECLVSSPFACLGTGYIVKFGRVFGVSNRECASLGAFPHRSASSRRTCRCFSVTNARCTCPLSSFLFRCSRTMSSLKRLPALMPYRVESKARGRGILIDGKQGLA